MTLDPNWLYSATAQSAAAIVAIIGGFITSRILMLNAEKNSLKNQYEEATLRLNLLKQQEQEAYDLYQTMRVERFFAAITNDLKKETQLPSFEELLRRYPKWKLDYEVLKREYDILTQNRLRAKEFVDQHDDLIDIDDSIVFGDWLKKHNLNISGYDQEAVEEEYNKFRKRGKEARAKQQVGRLPSFLINFTMPELIMPPPRQPEYEVYRREKEDRKLESAKGRLTSLQYEVSFAENEVRRLKSQHDAFAYPKNLVWGYATIGYLALVGVVYPLVLLPAGTYSPIHKNLVVWLFVSGLAAVLIYIATQIKELLRK